MSTRGAGCSGRRRRRADDPGQAGKGGVFFALARPAPDCGPASIPRSAPSPPVKVVLTGGPHSGKTTLLEELARRRARVVPEAAIDVIGRLAAELGREAAREWRHTHVTQFQELIARRQLELEGAQLPTSGEPCFCDRGLVDGLVYFQLSGVEPSPFVRRAAGAARYDVVVLCELMLPFVERPESGRSSGLERALEIEARLERTYAGLGYPLLRLPALSPVATRADLLLERVRAHRRAGATDA